LSEETYIFIRIEHLTFSRTAVSGSIIKRTSLTSWLTLEPTCEAPTRITIDFGVLLTLPDALTLDLADALTAFE